MAIADGTMMRCDLRRYEDTMHNARKYARKHPRAPSHCVVFGYGLRGLLLYVVPRIFALHTETVRQGFVRGVYQSDVASRGELWVGEATHLGPKFSSARSESRWATKRFDDTPYEGDSAIDAIRSH
jgi:hypothetical protein